MEKYFVLSRLNEEDGWTMQETEEMSTAIWMAKVNIKAGGEIKMFKGVEQRIVLEDKTILEVGEEIKNV